MSKPPQITIYECDHLEELKNACDAIGVHLNTMYIPCEGEDDDYISQILYAEGYLGATGDSHLAAAAAVIEKWNRGETNE